MKDKNLPEIFHKSHVYVFLSENIESNEDPEFQLTTI